MTDPAKPVSYHVEDKSVMVPFFKPFVWEPALRLVPANYSANNLTLLGTLSSLVAFGLCVFAPATRFTMAAVAALIFGYFVLDNIDGAQARRAGTSSPLGEFLDHWLDSLNSTCMFMGAVLYFGILDTRAVLLMALATGSYAMTFWEQRVTGRIFMGAVGNVEGIVLTCGFYVAGAIVGPDMLLNGVIVSGWTAIDGLYVAACAATASTIVGPLVRVRKRLLEPVWLFSPIPIVLAWYLYGGPGYLAACYLIVALVPVVAGRLLISHVCRTRIAPHWFLIAAVPVAALGCTALQVPTDTQSQIALGLAAYAVLRIALDFRKTVLALRQYVQPTEFLGRFVRVDPSTPDPSTPGPSTPGPSTPGPSTPGPSTPDPSTPGSQSSTP